MNVPKSRSCPGFQDGGGLKDGGQGTGRRGPLADFVLGQPSVFTPAYLDTAFFFFKLKLHKMNKKVLPKYIPKKNHQVL